MNSPIPTHSGQSPEQGLSPFMCFGSVVTITIVTATAALGLSLLNVALPEISANLQISEEASVTLVTAYQIAMIIGLLPLAALGEIIGYRRVYLPGLLIFTLASAALSFTQSFEAAVVLRFIQGAGAAALLGVNTAILRFVAPPQHFGKILGLNTFVAGSAAAAGPVIASLVLSYASWNWLFLANLPLGILAFGLGWLAVPMTDVSKRQLPLLGVMHYMAAFLAIFAGINLISLNGPMAFSLPLLGGGGLMLALLWFIERQKEVPFLPVDLFRLPPFRLAVAAAVAGFAAQMLLLTYLPFWLVSARGTDLATLGTLMAIWPVCSMISALLAGCMTDRLGTERPGLLGQMIFGIGVAALLWAEGAASDMGLALALGLCGFGFGFFQPSNNRTLLSAAPRARAGSASGCLGTCRLVGQSIGSMLAAVLLAGGAGSLTAAIGAALLLVAVTLAVCLRLYLLARQ